MTRTSPFARSDIRISARTALVAAAALCASSACGQVLTPTFRQGTANIVCGPVFSGPQINHTYSALVSMHDPISVSDPGTSYLPPSAAASDYEVDLWPTGLALSAAGSSMRGSIPPNGDGAVYGIAAMNDQWNFNVSQATCFSLDAAVEVFVSTGAITGSQGFQIGADGSGLFTLADGTPTTYLSAYLNQTGSTSRHFSGTIAPGNYFITLSGQAEGNGAPRSSSYNNWVTLRLGAPANIGAPTSATACAGHPASFSVPAITGATYQWQIQTADGAWHDLFSTPTPIACPGGGDGTAYASPVTSDNPATVNIGVNACADATHWQIRCIVSNACGSGISAPATLSICAGDFNCDSTVDFFDYLDFVNDFGSQAAGADFNQDGTIDFFDYLDFVNAFSAGC